MSELARQLPRTTGTNLPNYAKDVDRPYVGDPWLRQPHESVRAYSAFRIYIDLPVEERTFTRACAIYAERHGLKEGNKSWANKHRWAERAEAYDNFMTAKAIAAHRQQLVRSATKHAKQAADVQDVVMLPLNELRKRIEEQGGELDIVTQLGDAELMKLWKAMGGVAELTTAQKAERDALLSTGGIVAPRHELKAKGEIVRRLLANPALRELTEKVRFEVTVPVEDQPADE